jgi:hypothetical protein
MRHSSTPETPPIDSSDCIDLILAVRPSARIHDWDQRSPSALGIASAAVRGALEALIAGDSGEDCRGPARLRREIEIVMKFGKVPEPATRHWR